MFQFTGFALPDLCIQSGVTQRAGFPHSDICGSMLYCQLPAAFRRLTRLSSPVIAKASIICTYSLDPIMLSPLARSNVTSFSSSRVCDTASIRLACMRLDTIKNPFRIQLPPQWFYPSPLPRESLLYFFQIFKEQTSVVRL